MDYRIKQRMFELGLTQGKLAELSGLSQPAIYKLVSGKSKATSKINELAKALECDVTWLKFGDEDSTISTLETKSLLLNFDSIIEIISIIEEVYSTKEFNHFSKEKKLTIIKLIHSTLNSKKIDSETLRQLLLSIV